MTQKIYKDGTDQYVLTRLASINNTTGAQALLLGASEGAFLQTYISTIVLAWSEYKNEDDSFDPVIKWNSGAGMWKITIPHVNVTQLGTAWLNISGVDESGISIIPAAIEVDVVSRMAYEKIVPLGSYELDAAAKTILLKNDFSTTTLEQIKSIRNITQNQDIYLSSRSLPHKLIPDNSTPGLFEFVYNGTMANDDVLQITVNKV